MSRVTQREIARKAGVSINTVSRALNNKPDINPATKKKIIQIAKDLGYVPNLLAKSLKSGETKTIGVVVSNLFNPFFGPVIYGIDEKIRKKGYSIIICNSDNDYRREEDAIMTLVKKRVDGILVTPVKKGSLDASFLQNAKIPCVLMMSQFKSENFDYVGFDDKMGTFLATEYLIKKGHKRILYLSGPPYFSLSQDRLAGYRKALEDNKIKMDKNLIKFVTPK
ncbi:LacI family DNA-binding transcriptional regulator, partial [Candidatus Aerophobetes bacterium]|nr:LacI family DNA-binding transcriptional regulator [Candidatus Aerophobetes bacterium]